MIKYLLFSIVLLLSISCARETPVVGNAGNGQQVQITVATETRGTPNVGSPADRAISSLRVLGYNTSDGLLAFNEVVANPNLAGQRIDVLTGRYTVVFIANEASDPTYLQPDLNSITLTTNTTLAYLESLGVIWVAFDTTKDIPMMTVRKNVVIQGDNRLIDPSLPSGNNSFSGRWPVTLTRLGVRADLTVTLFDDQYPKWHKWVYLQWKLVPPLTMNLFPGKDNSSSTMAQTGIVYVDFSSVTPVSSGGKTTVTLPRAFIVPEILLSGAHNVKDNGLVLQLGLNDGTTLKGTVSLTPGDYNIPRNTYLDLKAETNETEITFGVSVLEWDGVDLNTQSSGKRFNVIVEPPIPVFPAGTGPGTWRETYDTQADRKTMAEAEALCASLSPAGTDRLPTSGEWQTLIDGSTNFSQSVGLVNGMRFENLSPAAQAIFGPGPLFLPASGSVNSGSLELPGFTGNYWSSTPGYWNLNLRGFLYFTITPSIAEDFPSNSFSVRCISDSGYQGNGSGTALANHSVAGKGEAIEVVATPDEGSVFDGWVVAGVTVPNPSANPLNFIMPEGDVTITPKFNHVGSYTVHVHGDLNGTLGTMTALPSSNVAAGTPVTVRATPASGSIFEKWTIRWHDGTHAGQDVPSFTATQLTTNPLTFNMPHGDIDVWLNSRSNFRVIVNSVPNVTVDATGGTTNANSTTALTTGVPAGTVVSYTATAQAGYAFAGWDVPAGVTPTYSGTNNSTVTFTMPVYDVTISPRTTQIFKVTVNPATGVTVTNGTNGTTAINPGVPQGTQVSYTATAQAGYAFAGWDIPASITPTYSGANNSTITFTMPAENVTISPRATQLKYKVTVGSVTGVTVAATPSTISPYYANSEAALTIGVPQGQWVSYTATVQAGYTFTGWDVPASIIPNYSGANNITLTFTMPAADVTLSPQATAPPGAPILYWDASTSTMRVAEWGTVPELTVPNYATSMIFTKFGGTVGFVMRGADGTAFGVQDIRFDPTTGPNTPITGYGYSNDNLQNFLPNVPARLTNSTGEVSSDTYHTLANVRQGRGDICRLAGMTVADINAMSTDADLYAKEAALAAQGIGGWRLPSKAENDAFISDAFTPSIPGAGFVDSPLFITKGGVPMLPAAGNRSMYGSVLNQGVLGYYWSSTPGGVFGGSCLVFYPGIKSTGTQNSAFGHSIRCVRK
jgi:hypothetical protein